MDCQEARDVIHAYFDGELDLVRTLDFERHIHDCQSCSRAHKGLMAMRSSIRGSGLYFKAPLGLEQRIRADVRKARGEAQGRPVSIVWRWMAMAASVAFIAFALWTLVRTPGVSQEKLLAQEVRASHVRSLMGTHLMDVESSDHLGTHLVDVKSSDQHTVKPWFDGKLDFAPDVRDFKAESFPLVGGRLDYLADRPVAALVYRHDKHFINLFIWPAPNETDRAETELVEKGYSVIHWIRAGINYWAISDTSDQTLRRFADLYRDQGAAATMP